MKEQEEQKRDDRDKTYAPSHLVRLPGFLIEEESG